MASELERAAVSKILQTCANPCIVDLGAHHGEDSEWMAGAAGAGVVKPIIIMVEADRQNYEMVAATACRLNAISIWGAIASHTGHCPFWVCNTPEGRGSGSIRKPTGHLKEKPWYDFRLAEDDIPCFTLDDLFAKECLDHIDILWVDIQGAENSMVAGGQKALKHTRYLFLEAEKRILYDGQSIREDLLAMLPGWTVIGDFDFNLLLRNDN